MNLSLLISSEVSFCLAWCLGLIFFFFSDCASSCQCFLVATVSAHTPQKLHLFCFYFIETEFVHSIYIHKSGRGFIRCSHPRNAVCNMGYLRGHYRNGGHNLDSNFTCQQERSLPWFFCMKQLWMCQMKSWLCQEGICCRATISPLISSHKSSAPELT